jgi:hypothetical protein
MENKPAARLTERKRGNRSREDKCIEVSTMCGLLTSVHWTLKVIFSDWLKKPNYGQSEEGFDTWKLSWCGLQEEAGREEEEAW